MARRCFLGLVASLGLLLAARPVFAQRAPELAAGLDEVILKNGGMLRGTVVAAEPDKFVTVFIMRTGEQRNIPWAEVERVERGKHAPICPATPEAPRSDPSSPAPASDRELELAYARGERGVVRLHVDSSDPGIQLYRVSTSSSTVQYRTNPGTVAAFPQSDLNCLAPCDKLLDGRLGQQFFFGGAGMPPSSTFQVYGRSGPLSASVEPGNDARYIAGLLTGTFGGLTATIGATVWALGYIEGDQQKKNRDGTPMIDAKGNIIIEHGPLIPGGKVAGPISFGIGAAALVVGILVGRSAEISYTLSPQRPGTSVSLSPTGFSARF